jgi:uncharacterized protein
LVKATLLAAALQGAVTASAQQGGVAIGSLFPARPTGYVTDVARVLDAASVTRLEALSARLRERTGAEIATVVLPSIGSYTPVDVAVAIGRAWGVGARADVGDARRNAGLVILLVPRNPADDNSGHIFIAPGQGLEGIVTDLQAGRTRDEMLPHLRAGRIGDGLVAGVERLSALIERGMGTPGAPPEEPRGPNRVLFGLGMFVFIMIVLVVASSLAGPHHTAGRRRRRRRGGFWDGFGGGGFGGGIGGFGGGGFGGGGFGGGGFGGFGGGGGFSGGGAGGRF